MSLNIGVFLGSKLGDDKKNFNLIKKFSKWFIKQNHTLIIGGTDSGLMQILAEEVYKKVNVKAIYTQQSIDSSRNYDFYTELIIVNDSFKKKEVFEKKSDLFIAFPGGIGTLDEIIDIINRNLLKEINKKLFLIDDNFYWKKFNDLLNYLKSKNFSNGNYRDYNLTICNFEKLKNEINKIDAQNKS